MDIQRVCAHLGCCNLALAGSGVCDEHWFNMTLGGMPVPLTAVQSGHRGGKTAALNKLRAELDAQGVAVRTVSPLLSLAAPAVLR